MKDTLETVYELLEIVEHRKETNLPLCNLLVGDPNLSPPQSLLKSLENSVYDGSNGYSPAKGDPELINAIRSYDKVSVNSSQIMIGNGSKTLVYITLKLLLNPGDTVCIFTPYYPAYQSLLLEFKAKIIYIDHLEDYLTIIEESRPTLVIMTSPNNPDGYTFSKDQLEEISTIVKLQKSFLILDEAYRNYIYDNSLETDLQSFSYDNHIIALRTFSKGLAICGWRIGYVIASAEMIKKMVQIQLSFFNPLNRVMQRALTKYLLNPDSAYPLKVKSIFEDRLRKICLGFSRHNIQLTCPIGAFYLFIQLNIPDTQELCLDLARETGIILWPGFDFGKANYIRISIAQLNVEDIDPLVNQLVKHLQKNKVQITQ